MHTVEIELLDRIYEIKCPETEEASLKKAAQFLNQNLKHHRNSSYVSFTDALAISALNACDLLLKAKENDITSLNDSNSKLNLVHQQVKKLLAE
jgi:cell division protein ZapA (FtsZ GTPase activity inhibitor)